MNRRPARPAFLPVVVTVAVLALAGCDRAAPPPPVAPGPSVSGHTVKFTGRVDGLRAEPVQSAGTLALTLPGRLAWDEDRTVRVMPPFAGRVLRPLVALGDTVRAGQPLAEMASAEYGTAVAEARGAENDARLAEETLRRQKELFEAGLVAQRELRQAEADLVAKNIERSRTQTRLQQIGGGSGPNYLLRAPIGGVVVERTVNPGQELRPDTGGTALFTITDPTRLWVRVDATEADLDALVGAKPGTPLTLSSVAYPGRRFAGTLTALGAAVDPESRTLRLRGAVPNADGLLKGEMYVNVSFPVSGGEPDAPLHNVPSSAVLMSGGRHHVFVLDEDGGFTRTDVQVRRAGAGRSVVQGLADGQRVVVEGNQFLDQILVGAKVAQGGASAAHDGGRK